MVQTLFSCTLKQNQANTSNTNGFASDLCPMEEQCCPSDFNVYYFYVTSTVKPKDSKSLRNLNSEISVSTYLH